MGKPLLQKKTDISNEMQSITLLYDKECPACHWYCQLVRIEASVGKIKLLDARKTSPLLDEVTRRGWDVDQGMILQVGQSLYYGSEAIHVLAKLGGRNNFFNRFNHWLFRSPWRAKTLYPILRNLRNILLKLLGKTKLII